MYFFSPTLRTTTLLLFTFLTLSYALPTSRLDPNNDSSSGSTELLQVRAPPKPTKKPPTNPPKSQPKPPTKPKPDNKKQKQGSPPPPTAKSGSGTPIKDGRVPKSYQPKVRVRDEAIQQYRRDLVLARDYSNEVTEKGLQVLHNRNSDLEARRGGAGGDIAEVIMFIVDAIKSAIEADKLARSKFTQETIANFQTKYPQFNWIMCHTKHETFFDGDKGVQWGHQHVEFDIKLGGTIGYEVYWAKSGKFSKTGDGGYLNWAYRGYINQELTKTDKHGATVVFVPPP